MSNKFESQERSVFSVVLKGSLAMTVATGFLVLLADLAGGISPTEQILFSSQGRGIKGNSTYDVYQYDVTKHIVVALTRTHTLSEFNPISTISDDVIYEERSFTSENRLKLLGDPEWVISDIDINTYFLDLARSGSKKYVSYLGYDGNGEARLGIIDTTHLTQHSIDVEIGSIAAQFWVQEELLVLSRISTTSGPSYRYFLVDPSHYTATEIGNRSPEVQFIAEIHQTTLPHYPAELSDISMNESTGNILFTSYFWSSEPEVLLITRDGSVIARIEDAITPESISARE